ncbi:hypothetical protein Vafri_7100, partial [Volvox africanus]
GNIPPYRMPLLYVQPAGKGVRVSYKFSVSHRLLYVRTPMPYTGFQLGLLATRHPPPPFCPQGGSTNRSIRAVRPTAPKSPDTSPRGVIHMTYHRRPEDRHQRK